MNGGHAMDGEHALNRERATTSEEGGHGAERPVVLFACVHNAGRSVAAKVLAEHHAQGRIEVRSAGSEPESEVNPVVAAVLEARGLSASGESPTRLSEEVVGEADVVVTMGCGETCPFFPGKRYLDWTVEDPAGKDRARVERIVDEIETRVLALLAELAPADGAAP